VGNILDTTVNGFCRQLYRPGYFRNLDNYITMFVTRHDLRLVTLQGAAVLSGQAISSETLYLLHALWCNLQRLRRAILRTNKIATH